MTAGLRGLQPLRASVRDPALRRAQSCFAFGWLAEWTATVGIGIVAFRDGGAGAVGIVGLARMLPAALAAPLAAPLADRARRERVLVVIGAVRAVLLLAAAAAVAAGATGAVYLLVVLAGVVGVLFRPAHSALLAGLCATAQDVAGANAARGLLDAAAVFTGPFVATLLLGLDALPSVFVAAGLASAAGAVSAARVRYEPAPREVADAVSGLAAVRRGAAVVAGSSHLRLLVGLALVQTMARGTLTVVTVVLSLDLLDAGEAGAGGLTTAIGAGGLLGAVLVAPLAGSRRLAVWSGLGIALWGAPLVLVAGVSSYWLVAVLLAWVGVGNAIMDMGLFTLIARLAPDAVLARVFALLEAVIALGVGVGAVVTPPVLEVAGLRLGLVLLGAVAPVCVVLALPRLRALDAAMLERDDRVAALRAVPMLRVLPMPALEQLAVRLERQDVQAGTDVVREGAQGESFFLLVHGEAEVLHGGRRLRSVLAGDCFGEVALLRDVPRTATVRALTPLRVWVLRREQFLAAVRGFSRSLEESEALLAGLVAVPDAPPVPAARAPVSHTRHDRPHRSR